VLSLPAAAVNIAPLGTGLLGSNDATLNDTGTSHANAGTVANIRDGNFTTRVDNYQANQAANVNGYVGISWAAARTDVVKSLTLTMACFVDGGWFGNQECPQRSRPLTPDMLVAPVVQVSTNLTAWTTVPAAVNYVSAFNGHIIAGDNTPTSRAFTVTLPQWQTGIRGIRLIGSTGGYGDGNGFLGVFELEVNADTITDTDTDGMDDAWETANGLAAGTNDAALDADSDGLSNVLEFRWQTNPQQPDSDGDGLTDGAEHTTHHTWPTAADTDGDSLSDAAEINTHSTNPLLADSDGDGLTDAAEISTHLTTATNRDTDNDGFPDGIEIQLSTDALSDGSRPPDAARAGTAILGTSTSGPRGAAGRTAHLNDGDGLSLANTNATPSFAGVVWPAAWPQPIARMEVTLATSDNAGWFGTANTLAGYGALAASNLTAPSLQTTTDGTTWTTVPTGNYTTDYIARFTGHSIGGLGRNDATRRSAVFTFNAPVAGLRGIRVSGACRTHLCVADIKVADNTNTSDTDADGLSNAQEAIAGTSPLHADTDGDGLSDGTEVNVHNSNPLFADSDADYFPDGLEVRESTAPVNAASHPANLSLAGSGILGVATTGQPTIYPTVPGTTTVNVGSVDHIVDGYITTRVDAWNNAVADPYDFVGARFAQRVQAAELKVQFATFNHAGWYGTNVSPGAGGTLTAAHLIEPRVQVTYDTGAAWYDVPATSDYIAQLTGHVIAGADNLPTRTPVVTFTLLSPATGINGIRLMGREGGNPAPFVGVFEFAITPDYGAPATSVTLNTVPVGDAGNAAHPGGLGRVDYTFQIAATETSLRDYCAFLNAAAATDPNGLWNPAMATDRQTGGILRLGTSGSFQYHVMGDGRRPVTQVSWFDAARYVNWLHNGQGSGSTEFGAYALAEPSNVSIGQIRQPGATVALPTRDEWLKAACFDPAKPGWWDYAMKTDTLPPNTTGGNYLDVTGNWAATQTFSNTQPATSLTTPGGHYAAAASAYGTFDQTGNVWEYTEKDSASNFRTAAGSSWFDPHPIPASASSTRVTLAPSEDGVTGFRVVVTAPAPVMFSAAPVSGKVNVWVGGADGGAGYGAGPNFQPNGASSFLHAGDSFTGGVPFLNVSHSYWNALNGGDSISNNGTATVAPGKIELKAGNASPTEIAFFGGFAHGGWEETMQVNVPGRSGESAWLLLNIEVKAGLNAGPARGGCSLRLGISVENGGIPSNPPGLISGSSSAIYPGFAWGNTNFNSALWDNKFVNETITAPIPVVIGQRFRLRLYGIAHAGLGGISAPMDPSMSSVNASAKTVGFAGLLEDPLTFPIPGYTVLSASGTNYSQTLPPVKFGVEGAALTFLPSGQIQITWPSLAGEVFTIDASDDLGAWQTIPGTITATGDMASRLLTPAPNEQRGFYRPWRLF